MRVYSNSATIIDNILTNKIGVGTTTSNILANICDYYSHFCFLISFFQKPSSRDRLLINFSRNVCNSESSISEAFSCQTLPCDQADVDFVVSLSYNMLIAPVDKHAPLRTTHIVCIRSFVRHEEQVASENLLE